jgi:hypothetical protein
VLARKVVEDKHAREGNAEDEQDGHGTHDVINHRSRNDSLNRSDFETDVARQANRNDPPNPEALHSPHALTHLINPSVLLRHP